ncbi:AAA ATPase [Bacteriophage sp.]|nr:AAA ATPase [Bacteriophage sp.]
MTEHIETGTQTSPTAEYEPLKVDFTPTPAVVPLVAWTWNTPVIPQFYWNVYSAEQRIKQICLEIGRIQEYLNYFAAHYNKMSGYLNKRIDKLTAAMYAEVERLDKAIEEENKARKLADELLQKGLDSEIARAKAAEIVLQQNIDANTTLIEDEEKRAKDAEEKLTTDLHDETAARIAEDKKINDTVETNRQHAEEVDAQLFDSIRTEANIRKNADNLLSDRIDKETEERKADDASINTRIDKETEERKNDVVILNTRVDNEQNERVKADNALDKRVTDNAQSIEHETERAKSAETNLNDALEREVDARQDDTRNLENQIDKVSTDSAKRDGVLQANINVEAEKRATEDNKKVSVVNVKSAIGSRITVKTANENTENATVTIGDTFDADFNKVNEDIEAEKQRAIAKENELSGKVEHETQERQTETNALNAEVAKRPTLDKFIAGENITLTPDTDKTTLTISSKGLTEKESKLLHTSLPLKQGENVVLQPSNNGTVINAFTDPKIEDKLNNIEAQATVAESIARSNIDNLDTKVDKEHFTDYFVKGDNINYDVIKEDKIEKIKISAVTERTFFSTVETISINKNNIIYEFTYNFEAPYILLNAYIEEDGIADIKNYAAFTISVIVYNNKQYIHIVFNAGPEIAMPTELRIRIVAAKI